MGHTSTAGDPADFDPGEHGNVLKIRPPLVFAEADAARLLTELDAVLAALPA